MTTWHPKAALLVPIAAQCLVVTSLLVGCTTTPMPTARQAQTPNEVHEQIIRTIQIMFDAMEARDPSRLERVLLSDAMFYSIPEKPGDAEIRTRSAKTFIDSIIGSQEPSVERMQEPVVHIDGSVATVWTYYTLHQGGRFSHCGYDSFQLIRVNKEWRIAAVLYNLRPPGECK